MNGKHHVQGQQARCMQHLVVLLPVLNEALGLAWVLDRIPYARLKRNGYRTTVLVMDGHSTDSTPEVAAEYGAMFVDQDDTGKGSAIRRVTGALDPRLYRTIQIAAPSEDELAQPWLWRFWRNVPARGQFTIFDRSWYGRVLVERVEGFCSPDEWLRAYTEINEFEEQLVDAGVVVVKFWLSIDKQTQLERFKEREDTPHKRFKITEEDWRNREKWDSYSNAVADMVDRTSTEIAPWTLVEANDKRFARVKVLRTLNDALDAAIS